MQDEFERFQSDKAFKYLGLFFTISLAVWSLYNLIVYGNAGHAICFICTRTVCLFRCELLAEVEI